LKKSGKMVICTGDLNVARNEKDVYDPKGKDKIPGYTP
jgi:exonuclease III